MENIYSKEKNQVLGVKKIIDDLNRIKFTITLMKGKSYAEPELYDKGKLIMLRLKIRFSDRLDPYLSLPPYIKEAINIVESVDIDFSLIEFFLRQKWKKKAVVETFITILDVYSVAEEGSVIGELEMDYRTFEEFLAFLKVLSFETFKRENVIGT